MSGQPTSAPNARSSWGSAASVHGAVGMPCGASTARASALSRPRRAAGAPGATTKPSRASCSRRGALVVQGHRIAPLGQRQQVLVAVGGAHHLPGSGAHRGLVGVRAQHPQVDAQGDGRLLRHARELAAADHADGPGDPVPGGHAPTRSRPPSRWRWYWLTGAPRRTSDGQNLAAAAPDAPCRCGAGVVPRRPVTRAGGRCRCGGARPATRCSRGRRRRACGPRRWWRRCRSRSARGHQRW